jgi:hypothetical protein
VLSSWASMIFIVKIIYWDNQVLWLLYIFRCLIPGYIVYMNIWMSFPIDHFSILRRWINRLKLHNILFTDIIYTWVINKFWKKLNTNILPLITFSVMHNFRANVAKVKGNCNMVWRTLSCFLWKLCIGQNLWTGVKELRRCKYSYL